MKRARARGTRRGAPVRGRRRARWAAAAVAAGVVAWALPAGCASGEEAGDRTRRIPLDDDGLAEGDLSRVPALAQVFGEPRRYPFTLAVAPLYVEWSDGGRQEGASTVHAETLASPIPGVDPRGHRQATAWPADRDPPDEEVAIARATREGVEQRAAGEATEAGAAAAPGAGEAPAGGAGEAPAGGAGEAPAGGSGEAPAGGAGEAPAGGAGEAPAGGAGEGAAVPARGRRLEGHPWLVRRPACPPEETSSAAEVGPRSSVALDLPAGWAPVTSETLLLGPAAAAVAAAGDGEVTITVSAVDRATLWPREERLERVDATSARLLERAEPLGLTSPREASWSGAWAQPAVECTADLPGAEGARVWVVLTDDQAFVVVLRGPPAAVEALADSAPGWVRVEGPPPADPRPAAPAAPAGPKRDAAAEARAGVEADALAGRNFAISETGFQDRMVGVLEQFGMFERVEKLKFVTDSQRRDPEQLLAQADARGADFMLVCRLRRNKVSFTGISSALRFLADASLWLAFWWPSEIWPGVRSEDWRTDVELVVELRDVRSREVLWNTTYRYDETVSLSQPDRGWIPWGIVWFRFGLVPEGTYAVAGGRIRPRSWLEVEYQVLRDLWSPEGFKGVLDAKGFEDRINAEVEPRRLGLVVGVSRYGPRTGPVLEALAREAGQSLEAQRRIYGDEGLVLGTRPYAEVDGQALSEFLVNDGAFGRGDVQTLLGAAATRLRLKAALRQVAKARRRDPVLVYLNGQTVVADDPTRPGDELKKYFLPWDADLVALEELRLLPDPAERTRRILEHLDRVAISFDWIAETFNQASLEDHRHLMSREVLIVLDCAFPGQITGLRYAPLHASRVAGGWVPARDTRTGGAEPPSEGPKEPPSEGPKEPPPERPAEPPPERPAEPPPERPAEPPPERPAEPPPERPAEPPPERPAEPPPPPPGPRPTRVLPDSDPAPPPAEPPPAEPPPAEPPPAEPPPRRVPRRVGALPGEGAVTTLPAQAERDGAAPGQGAAPAAGRALAPQLTEDFLQVLARVPGRKVVVTTRFNERALDVIPQKHGGFAYHFLRGARDRARVPAREVRRGDEALLVVESSAVLDYVRARVEDESRTLNQPQSLVLLGDNDDFPVIERRP